MCEALVLPLDLVYAATGLHATTFSLRITGAIHLLQPGPSRTSLAAFAPTLKLTFYPSLLMSLRSVGHCHAMARFVGTTRRRTEFWERA